jgi:hypothetical protein
VYIIYKGFKITLREKGFISNLLFLYRYICVTIHNSLIQIYSFLYNYVYGRFWVWIQNHIILFRLRGFSKTTKNAIRKRLVRMILYKREANKKRMYLRNMQMIVKLSEDSGIPQHVLIAKLKLEN